MPLDTQVNQFKENRFALRMEVRLPITVTGRTHTGIEWSEPCETENISTIGALFNLSREVKLGEQLHLCSHGPDETMVRMPAQVARTVSGKNDFTQVGVVVTEASESWLRFFVAWVAERQRETETINSLSKS